MTKPIERYNPRIEEPRWQKAWDDDKSFVVDSADPREKYYVLEMFPYPSGRIHMGHVRNYAMGDVLARYKRARGFNVLHPMGWDAFGLPAENAAKQTGSHPKTWTYANIDAMKKQLKTMGLSFDWTREFATCDPEYYEQQQKLFLDFLKAGLVTRKQSKVNWDPVDETVLANEQVIDGRGWRSGAVVEQRELTQWFLKISDYSEDLLEAIDGLTDWPDKVRTMQRNWIGRSDGLRLLFELEASAKDPRDLDRGVHHPARTRSSAPASSRCRPTTRWRPSWRRTTQRSRPSSTNSIARAPPPRHWRRPKSTACRPDFASNIR